MTVLSILMTHRAILKRYIVSPDDNYVMRYCYLKIPLYLAAL